MSGYKNFAVIGAGNIGSFIIDELVNLKSTGAIASVVVITRSDAKAAHPEWVSKGAKFATIDYDSEDTFKAAFEGVDVLISTISATIILKQLEFATAAKAAGVKLFLPSEFGVPTHEANGGVFLQKRQVQDKLRELDLPYSLIYTGFWTETTFVPPFGWNFETGKIDIGGKGDALVTFTARSDVIRFLGHVLVNVPASKLEWTKFSLEGQRTSVNQIVSDYEKKTGKKLEVTHTPLSTLTDNFSKNPKDLYSLLKIVWDQGGGIVETPTNVWPEWNPKSVLDVIAA